ncbi:hypothetical protein D3C76_1258480 [compost metagenome]
MIGHEGCQVRSHTNRPHARATATMGDAESFMQVHVRDVGTDVRGPGQADLGIEVGAVHVHLAAVGMNHRAYLADALFIHAMGRGVGRHQA